MHNGFWRKGLVLIIILVLIGSSSISLGQLETKGGPTNPLSRGNTLYVGGSGPNNYTKIQDAIDNASDGDTVFVYDDSSPYYGGVKVDKEINLIGEDKNTTILDGSGGYTKIISVQHNSVTISGFTLYNGTFGIEDSRSDSISHLSIINNIIKNNSRAGIYFSTHPAGNQNTYHTVIGNTISNNRIGLIAYLTDEAFISNNEFKNNIYSGVYNCASENNTIVNNVFFSCGITLCYGDEETHTIENNTANGQPIRYYKNMNNVVVPTDTAQVILINCTNFIIQNLNLSNVTNGIQLVYSSYNTITGCYIADNTLHGIVVEAAPQTYVYHNNISRNIIVNNLRGIHISVIRSLNHTISENTIENNTYGIFLWSHLDYDWLFDGHGPRVDKESTVISNDQLIFPFLRPNIITKNNFMNNNYNANFSVNRFFSLRWINNFWESPHLLPKLIFGIMNWRGEKRKWINFDFRPAKEPYDIPRIAI